MRETIGQACGQIMHAVAHLGVEEREIGAFDRIIRDKPLGLTSHYGCIHHRPEKRLLVVHAMRMDSCRNVENKDHVCEIRTLRFFPVTNRDAAIARGSVDFESCLKNMHIQDGMSIVSSDVNSVDLSDDLSGADRFFGDVMWLANPPTD